MQRKDDHRPWLTPDFEGKFKQAFGREMTVEERAFFGLNATEAASTAVYPDGDEDSE